MGTTPYLAARSSPSITPGHVPHTQEEPSCFFQVRCPLEAPARRYPFKQDTVALLTADLFGIAKRLAAELRQVGATAIIVQQARSVVRKNRYYYACDLHEQDQCRELAELIAAKHGIISTLVHLQPMNTTQTTKGLDIGELEGFFASDALTLLNLSLALESQLLAHGPRAIVLATVPLSLYDDHAYHCLAHAGIEALAAGMPSDASPTRWRLLRLSTPPLARSTLQAISEELQGDRKDSVVDYTDHGSYGTSLRPTTRVHDREPALRLSPQACIVRFGDANGSTDRIIVELRKIIDFLPATITPTQERSKAWGGSRYWPAVTDLPSPGIPLSVGPVHPTAMTEEAIRIFLDEALATFGPIEGIIADLGELTRGGEENVQVGAILAQVLQITALVARAAKMWQPKFCLLTSVVPPSNQSWSPRHAAITAAASAFATHFTTTFPGRFAAMFIKGADEPSAPAILAREIVFGRHESPVCFVGKRDSLAMTGSVVKPGYPLLATNAAVTRQANDQSRIVIFKDAARLFVRQSGGKAPVLSAGMQIEVILESSMRARGDIGPLLARSIRFICSLAPNAARVVVDTRNPIDNSEHSWTITLEDDHRNPFAFCEVFPHTTVPSPVLTEDRSGEELSPLPIPIEDCYRLFIASPSPYRTIRAISGINEQRLEASLKPYPLREAPLRVPADRWICDPLILDGGLDLVTIWQHRYLGQELELASIDQFVHHASFDAQQDVECSLLLHSDQTSPYLRADLSFLQNGAKLAEIRGAQYFW